MEYTCKNWLQNKFECNSINLEKIEKRELANIRKEQMKIFRKLWEKIYEEYVFDFDMRFEFSEEKDLLMQNELDYVNSIVNFNEKNKITSIYLTSLGDIPFIILQAYNKIIKKELFEGNVYFGNITSPDKIDSMSNYNSDITLDLGYRKRAYAIYYFYIFLVRKKEIFFKEKGAKIKTKRGIPIWNESHPKSLKYLHTTLIERRYIEKIDFKNFKKHFNGEETIPLIIWKLTIPDLIYLFEKIDLRYFYPAILNNKSISPSVLSMHFGKLNLKNDLVANIRADSITSERSKSKTCKNKQILDYIINSIPLK